MDPLACGIEVSAQNLELCLALPGGGFDRRQLPNTRSGHRRLVAWLRRTQCPVHACMEATGVYGLDLALELSKCLEIEIMVANPRAARRFAEALMNRAKTDRIDAEVLCLFAQRMPFVPWQPPAAEALALRALTRRIQALTRLRASEKNRLHAAQASRTSPPSICASLKRHIRALNREIERLDRQALEHVRQHPQLKELYRLLLTVPGIGPKSAAALLSELAVLPNHLGPRQWVAHAGLDPKPIESGTSLRRRRRISKTGNARLRQALFMPVLVSSHCSPHWTDLYQRHLDRGLRPIQALVALMRKLLHVIYGIWKHKQPFDGRRLCPKTDALT